PAHAVVLSVDEKSQIQALDRTQPGLPMKPGRAGTMTHDYKRNGTTTLFAALNVLDGTVIGRNMQRHRHQEFIRFLNAIEAQLPARKAIRLSIPTMPLILIDDGKPADLLAFHDAHRIIHVFSVPAIGHTARHYV